MGAVAKTDQETGQHVGTGKLPVEPHEPQWGEWSVEGWNVKLRCCRHPDCDVEDYTSIIDGIDN